MVLAAVAAFVLVLPVRANEKPTESYQKAEKELNTANTSLRNNLRGNIDFAIMGKDAEAMKAAFTVMLEFWQSKQAEDAVKLSQDGLKAALDLEKAVKAENRNLAADAQAAIAGASSTGEIGAIGTCAPCHLAHRQRLPDGTFEVK
jgi:hypothetical protein